MIVAQADRAVQQSPDLTCQGEEEPSGPRHMVLDNPPRAAHGVAAAHSVAAPQGLPTLGRAPS